MITSTAAIQPVQAQLPPLQQRTPDQLKEGLVVDVRGAGATDLAAARLIQDGAQFIAKAAGTTMGLAAVDINYRTADQQGALGLATFSGNKGWFGLSMRSTAGIMEGINRLKSTPFDQWTEQQRQAFVQANETILHEAGHVTLPAYDSANIGAWRDASRSFEEGLTEVVTMTRIGDFMREEFGVELSPLTSRITQSTSAYTRFSERITRMLEMSGDGSAADLKAAASLVADGVRADQRLATIANRIATNLGGPSAPPALAKEIEKTLEGFVDERNGTRTRLMELQAALVDVKAGTAVDVPKLIERLHQRTRELREPENYHSEPIGKRPIE